MFSFLKSRKNPRLTRLKSVELFSTLSWKELEILDQMLHERTYLKDEFIFDEDDEGQALFIVLKGKVKTRKVGSPADGVEFGPGSFFGILALFEEVPRSTEARAVEDSEVVAFFRTDFVSLLKTEANIGSKISYAIALDLARHLRRVISRPEAIGSL